MILLKVTKLKTITLHHDHVEAPCEYAADCGGCKTQNLLYEAQVRAKEQQVHDLVVHVGKFSIKDTTVLKPIVPCDMQFHYRNKVNVLIFSILCIFLLVLSKLLFAVFVSLFLDGIFIWCYALGAKRCGYG